MAFQSKVLHAVTTLRLGFQGTCLAMNDVETLTFRLVHIQNLDTGSGRVEVSMRDSADQFQAVQGPVASDFGCEDNGTWVMTDWDAQLALGYIKTRNTPHNHVEVHIATGDRYEHRAVELGSRYVCEEQGVWTLIAFAQTSVSDLAYVKTRNTGTGTFEVHESFSESRYQAVGLQTGTTFALESDGQAFLAAYSNASAPDLFFVKTANTPSGNVEVHIASVGSTYRDRILETAIPLACEDNGRWFYKGSRMGGPSQMVYVQTRNTPSGMVEVQVFE